jgi:hypothetical protein
MEMYSDNGGIKPLEKYSKRKLCYSAYVHSNDSESGNYHIRITDLRQWPFSTKQA